MHNAIVGVYIFLLNFFIFVFRQMIGATNGNVAQYHQYHQGHLHAGNGVVIKRNVLSNSLVDINDPGNK